MVIDTERSSCGSPYLIPFYSHYDQDHTQSNMKVSLERTLRFDAPSCMTLVVEGVRTIFTESAIIAEVYPASGGTLYRQLYLTGYWTIQASCQVRLQACWTKSELMSSVNLPNEDAMVSPTLILYERKRS